MGPAISMYQIGQKTARRGRGRTRIALDRIIVIGIGRWWKLFLGRLLHTVNLMDFSTVSVSVSHMFISLSQD